MYDMSFVDELASSAPVPGGGGASAYAGAIASSLASMVGNLTVGKKKYADVEDEVYEVLSRLAHMRARLFELIDADAEAFLPLSQAYGMPRATQEEQAAKDAALQAALIDACEVPLAIIEQCLLVARECDFLAHKGSRLAVSDAGCAVVLARAAAHAASLNVRINIASMTDSERAQDYRCRMNDMLVEVDGCASGVYEYVLQELE